MVLLAEVDSGRDRQLAAIAGVWDSVRRGELTRAEARELLKGPMWKPAYPDDVRQAALRALIADPAGESAMADTVNALSLLLPTEQARAGRLTFVEDIANEAVKPEHRWVELIPAFVRSWSRPFVGEQELWERPERDAIAQLSGRPPHVALLSLFAGVYGGDERERLAAWELLAKLADEKDAGSVVSPHALALGLAQALAGEAVTIAFADAALTGEIRGELSRLASEKPWPDNDPIMASLTDGYRLLGVVPSSAGELQRLTRLLGQRGRPFVTRASALLAELDVRQRDGVALTHLPMLLWAKAHRPTWLSACREDLLDQCRRLLEGQARYFRGGSTNSETLRINAEAMSWADMLSLRVAIEASRDPSLPAAAFAQADRDHMDTTTEMGGVLDWNAEQSRFVAWGYEPSVGQRYGDERFVAPVHMIEGSDEALYHYHLQVPRYELAGQAGPSFGDFAYAKAQGRHCLVMTFITKDRLNIDFYTPEGVVIDLGTISRPAGGDGG